MAMNRQKPSRRTASWTYEDMTMKHRKVTGLVLFVCVFIFLAILSVPFRICASSSAGHWPDLQDIEGKAWVVIDRVTGEVIVENQADLPVYPASTTKIMTAILAIESGILDHTVTVSETAVKLPYGSSRAGFLATEQVVLKDVLYGLLLASGNDAANILAEALAGSQEAFAAQMNAKAALPAAIL
jgi:D-alanyl-D-alanine carboxypeptidase (penicillin-binding protein 5/6)